ncbi:MAG: metallophosphoesterase [Acidobacteria bacterium]|nr:metallophosphoesterase [Acidobacteriota bacterium]
MNRSPEIVRLPRRVAAGLLLLAPLFAAFGSGDVPASGDRDAFSIIALPDTQLYSETYPRIFEAQTSWIKRNRSREHIAFVTHLGDIVQNGGRNPTEWKRARRAMYLLDGVVPWGVDIGNHDYDRPNDPQGAAQTFLASFGPAHFRGRAWYGGSSTNGLNCFQLVSIGHTRLVILHLEADIPDAAIGWAEAVLKRHPDRQAIISTHIYLDDRSHARTGKAYFRPQGNSGELIWQKLVRKQPQIFMVLCGHWGEAGGEWHQISTNDAGHPVLEVLSDYQRRNHGGDGWLRILKFLPRKQEIHVRTYSPTLNRYATGKQGHFTLPWHRKPAMP